MNAVAVRGLVKRYRGFDLGKLDFEVPEGYVAALIGPNGAGKTTLLKALLGLAPLDSGEVEILGFAMPGEELRAKEEIGFAPETPCLYERLTPIEMGALAGGFFRAWDGARYAELLGRLDVPPRKRIKELSKGAKMKCQLALALSHKARLLVLDEPAAGLDPEARLELLDLIRAEMELEGRTALISSHITSDLDKIADFFFVLRAGRIVLSGSRTDLEERLRLVRGDPGQAELLEKAAARGSFGLLGMERGPRGFTALVDGGEAAAAAIGGHAVTEAPRLEDLLVYGTKGESDAQAGR